MSTHIKLKRGYKVAKRSGDYTFFGWIVAIFKKRSGQIRYVVEDERGLLLIMNEQQLQFVSRGRKRDQS